VRRLLSRRCQQDQPPWKLRQKNVPVGMADEVRPLQIVHPRPPEGLQRKGKAARLDDMQRHAEAGSGARECTDISGLIWTIEGKIEHFGLASADSLRDSGAKEDTVMPVHRTPDDRFEGLEAWPYAPHYTMVDGGALGPLRIAHAEAGPPDAPVILCMHGEPSWSYLYRKMMPVFAEAGFRAVAPDLVGFGRSDKPSELTDYSYAGHVAWMLDWFDQQDFRDVTLFCQDWGGLIGLRLVTARPERFARVVVANSFLPTGEGKTPEAFARWREFSQTVPDFDSGWIVNGGTARGTTDAIRAAYNAPFPDDRFKAGARRFPMLVPTEPDWPEAAENREAWKVLEKFEKPFLTLFGDSDFVTLGSEKVLQARVPGTRGQEHRILEKAGHFIQEDIGEELAALVLAFIARHA